MQFTVNRKQLVAIIETASKFAKSKLHPFSENVMITVSSGSLKINATNSATFYEASTACEATEPISFCTPVKPIKRALKGRTLDVTFIIEDNELTLINGVNKTRLLLFSTDEMPSISETYTGQFTITNLKAIARIASCASKNKKPEMLKGLNLQGDGVSFKAAASDVSKLAFVEQAQAEKPGDITVVAELFLILEKEFGQSAITCLYSDVLAEFSDGKRRFTTRLIPGRYLDYKKIIPLQFQRTAEFNRQLLLDILDVAPISYHDRATTIEFDTDASFKISSQGSDFAADGDLISSSNVSGFRFSVRKVKLQDILRLFPDENVILKMNDDKSPIVIQQSGILALVMAFETRA